MIIYKVTNKIDQKIYIGKTTKLLEERKAGHLYDVKYGSGTHFHNALRKYGSKYFDWQVIDQASTVQELNEKEKYWIQFYKSFDPAFGYNLTLGGDGVVPTEETLQNMSKAHKGFVPSNSTRMIWSEQRTGAGNPMWGKHFSDSTKKKMSEMRKGKTPRLGKSFSEKSLVKMSASHKGKRLSEETKQKISRNSVHIAGFHGKHHSEETKRKISESLQKRYQIVNMGKEK